MTFDQLRLQKVKGARPKNAKELIVLHMPQNSAFHERLVKHRKGADRYMCKQLFTPHYELIFERTGWRNNVDIDGKRLAAEVFAFKKIIPASKHNSTKKPKWKE